MPVRGCLFFLLLIVIGAFAIMQCPGNRQPEVAQEEVAPTPPPPPPPPPDTKLPVNAELAVGGGSSLIVHGKTVRYGVSAVSASGDDAIVVAWVEPADSPRESYSLHTDAARSTAIAGPIIVKLTGVKGAGDGTYLSTLEITAPVMPEMPDSTKQGGNH